MGMQWSVRGGQSRGTGQARPREQYAPWLGLCLDDARLPRVRPDHDAVAVAVLEDGEDVVLFAEDRIGDRVRAEGVARHDDPVRIGELAGPDLVLGGLV